MEEHTEEELAVDHVQVVQEVGEWVQDQVHTEAQVEAQDQVAQDRVAQDHMVDITDHRDHQDHQDIITIITTMVEHTTVEEEVAADAQAYWQ